MNSCRLCSRDVSTQPWNEPLFESENFVVVPSLGALVEGWLLILPKQHYLCLGVLPRPLMDEMTGLKQTVLSFCEAVYGEVCAFEHGPHQQSRNVGCGVDHAHLHLVPLSFDLLSAAEPFLPKDITWSSGELAECQTAFLESKDYLYLEQPIGCGSIATHDQFVGQLFRRAIATQLGLGSDYDWRKSFQLQNVEATIERARTWNETRQCQTKVKTAA